MTCMESRTWSVGVANTFVNHIPRYQARESVTYCTIEVAEALAMGDSIWLSRKSLEAFCFLSLSRSLPPGYCSLYFILNVALLECATNADT